MVPVLRSNMAVRKRRGAWHIDFQVRGIRYRYKSPGVGKEDAMAFERRLRSELAQYGEVRSLKPTEEERRDSPTLAEFAPRWLETYVKANNRVKEYKRKRGTLDNHLIPFFGSQKLEDITAERVEQYKVAKQALNPKTLNLQLGVLRKLLATAQEWLLIEGIPRIKLLKVPQPDFKRLTIQESDRLIAVAQEEPWRTMTLVALKTGMRYSELSALKWDDIDWERGVIAVKRSVVEGNISATKNSRIRYVNMVKEVREALEVMKKPSGFIFLFNGKLVLYKTARERLQRCCRDAGVPVISWHDLRHTFASQLSALGANIFAVQKLMGHSDIKMTERYTHLNTSELADAMKLLEKKV